MRVLVTGGLGFLGRAVVASLANHGNEVVAITHSRMEDSLPGASGLEVADLRNATEIRSAVADLKPEAICHLAALTSGRESFARPIDYYDVNTTGTINLLHAIEAMKAPTAIKIVFTSTSAIYGSGRPGALSEDSPDG